MIIDVREQDKNLPSPKTPEEVREAIKLLDAYFSPEGVHYPPRYPNGVIPEEPNPQGAYVWSITNSTSSSGGTNLKT